MPSHDAVALLSAPLMDASLPQRLPMAQATILPPGTLRWRAFGALVSLPVLWLLWLVFQYGVNVPHYDQWVGMAPVFQSMEAGHLNWQDFTAQHNEHRLPLPRLVFFATGLLTHWNTRVEMLLTVLVLSGVAAGLWRLLAATGWRARPATFGLFAILAWLVLNPLQEQNILFGFQFHFVIPLLFIVAAFSAALVLRQAASWLTTAALASAATFSMAAGLGAWGLILPLLLLRQREPGWKKWAAVWGGVFMLNLTLFLVGYHKSRTPGLSAVFQRPGEACYYLLVYLGGPFAWGTACNHPAAGAVIGPGCWPGWSRHWQPAGRGEKIPSFSAALSRG